MKEVMVVVLEGSAQTDGLTPADPNPRLKTKSFGSNFRLAALWEVGRRFMCFSSVLYLVRWHNFSIGRS